MKTGGNPPPGVRRPKMYGRGNFSPGDLVWFDPGVGYVLPGEVLEFHQAAQVGERTLIFLWHFSA